MCCGLRWREDAWRHQENSAVKGFTLWTRLEVFQGTVSLSGLFCFYCNNFSAPSWKPKNPSYKQRELKHYQSAE